MAMIGNRGRELISVSRFVSVNVVRKVRRYLSISSASLKTAGLGFPTWAIANAPGAARSFMPGHP